MIALRAAPKFRAAPVRKRTSRHASIQTRLRSLTVAALKLPTHQTPIQRQIDATDRQIDQPRPSFLMPSAYCLMPLSCNS